MNAYFYACTGVEDDEMKHAISLFRHESDRDWTLNINGDPDPVTEILTVGTVSTPTQFDPLCLYYVLALVEGDGGKRHEVRLVAKPAAIAAARRELEEVVAARGERLLAMVDEETMAPFHDPVDPDTPVFAA